jgi:site-specific DNA recombinase
VADSSHGWRLAAPELERAVSSAARNTLNDPAGVLEALEKSGIDSPDVRSTLASTADHYRQLENQPDAAACMVKLIDRVELRDDGISVTLKVRVPCYRAGVRTSSILALSHFTPLRLRRRGVETRIVVAAGGDLPRNADPALVKAVSRATVWFEELASGRVRSFAEIARREDKSRRYVERLSRLAFAAPASLKRFVKDVSQLSSVPRPCSTGSTCRWIGLHS